MGRINIDDLEPGMVLASDVKDRNGRVLLGTGNPLSEKNLRVFKIWGVTDADIKGVEKEELTARAISQIDPSLLKEIETEIEELFRYTDRTHPAITELFRLAVLRKVKQRTQENRDVQQSV